jgi:transposase
VGYNLDLKQIPVFISKRKLEGLCERYGIEVVEQEESYTSKASALDGDTLPIWNADSLKTYKFSGKRIERGL